jgi:hypothetical protein
MYKLCYRINFVTYKECSYKECHSTGPTVKNFFTLHKIYKTDDQTRRQQDNSKKRFLIAPFINYASSCQTHKSRIWE